MLSGPAPELKSAHVAVVGLGLMGGSLALALKPHVRKLTAVEIDEEARRIAIERHIVHAATANLQAGTIDADIVVLATPVSVILQLIEQLSRLRSQPVFLIDLGSTKREICDAMSELPVHFSAIGGHPMCGKETSGLSFAEDTLFQRQTFALCRTQRTTDPMEKLACAIVEAIGAVPLWLPAAQHDRQVAIVSHLPYMISALLMQLASEAAFSEEQLWSLSASGFRDASRLAGSDSQMMKDILRTNRDAVLDVLRQYVDRVENLLALLENDDGMALEEWLQLRQREHKRYREARESAAGAGVKNVLTDYGSG